MAAMLPAHGTFSLKSAYEIGFRDLNIQQKEWRRRARQGLPRGHMPPAAGCQRR